MSQGKYQEFQPVFGSTNQNATVLKQAIVLEVILNSNAFKDSDRLEEVYFSAPVFPKGSTPYLDPIVSKELKKQLTMAPENSVIAIIAGDKSFTPMLFYPVLSQHICLPIKPGENVWVLSDNLINSYSVTRQSSTTAPQSAGDGEAYCSGYWLSRVVAPSYVNDLNFTHHDRTRSEDYIAQQQPRATIDAPTFPNGIQPSDDENMGDPESYTLGRENDYRRIYAGIEQGANETTTREPVPNFSKRAGDLVLQGSNNAMICIGENRSDEDSQEFYSENTGPRKGGAEGTIDIVVGRCLTEDGEIDTDRITVVQNTREEQEKEKRAWALQAGKSPLKPGEGNVNYSTDASRIYVSMKSPVDELFNTGEVGTVNIDFQSTLSDGAPAIALKTDDARVYARNSLKILVEGGGEITMSPGGNIFFKPGANGQVFLGGGPDDPQAVYADLVTYPPGPAGNAGFVGEMAQFTKKPGTNFSSKVKVKL